MMIENETNSRPSGIQTIEVIQSQEREMTEAIFREESVTNSAMTTNENMLSNVIESSISQHYFCRRYSRQNSLVDECFLNNHNKFSYRNFRSL